MGLFFPDRPHLEPLENGIDWLVLENFSWTANDGTMITVPTGFSTDLCSSPRLLWAVCPPTGRHLRAAIIHDFLYATQRIDGKPIQQSRADGYYREASADCGVPRIKRWNEWFQLRVWGWIKWAENGKQII